MKIRILLWCCVVLLLWSCSDENDPSLFYEEVNWYEIKDNPDDVLDHTIYQIYKETGIPIFYNDTLGSEVKGVDVDGHPIVRYEIINLTYKLTTDVSNIKYRLPKNRTNILAGVELLRDYVIPELPSSLYVHSLLLTESLVEYSGGEMKHLNVYIGLQTIAVGKMQNVGTMRPEEKIVLAEEIVTDLLISFFLKSGGLDKFYAVSNRLSSFNDIYAEGWILESMGKTKEECGFLSSPEIWEPTYFKVPTKEQDLKDYMSAVKKYSEVEFRDLYGGYPWVMEKYLIVKTFFDDLKY